MLNNALISEFKNYNPKNLSEAKNAFKEIIQKIILCGLSRSNFFNYFSFYDGTSLRLIYGLSRFSEDLDFVVSKNNFNNDFNFEKYINYIKNELNFFSIDANVKVKEKIFQTSTVSMLVNVNLTLLLDLVGLNDGYKVNKEENISIKLDIETNYISGGINVSKMLNFPLLYKVETFDLPTLFSCKLLAILNRNWKNRVKGRDYYDFMFYMSKGVKPNLKYLSNGLKIENLTLNMVSELLIEKFNSIDFNNAYKDVVTFIEDNGNIASSFNKETFIDLANQLIDL